jgi:hypothetical protein
MAQAGLMNPSGMLPHAEPTRFNEPPSPLSQHLEYLFRPTLDPRITETTHLASGTLCAEPRPTRAFAELDQIVAIVWERYSPVPPHFHTLHTFHTAHWWLSPSEKSQDRHFMRVAALVGSAAIAAFPPARAARNEDRDTVHCCKHLACTSARALLAGQSALHTRGTHNARVGGGVATAATNGYPTQSFAFASLFQ